jgi:hypothetical protein
MIHDVGRGETVFHRFYTEDQRLALGQLGRVAALR